jgi:hypothetical protein
MSNEEQLTRNVVSLCFVIFIFIILFLSCKHTSYLHKHEERHKKL